MAFLDSDDAWRSDHIETALRPLRLGYEIYLSNFIAVGHAEIGHFEHVGTLLREMNKLLDGNDEIYPLAYSGLEHTVSDDDGLIGIPTVVYEFRKYGNARFREQFQIGADFFLWMDLPD